MLTILNGFFITCMPIILTLIALIIFIIYAELGNRDYWEEFNDECYE